MKKLQAKYSGNFVAVHEKKICFSDTDPVKLVNCVKSKYGDDRSVVASYLEKEREKFTWNKL